MNPTVAADVALVLFAAFAVLGFGWRSWLQYRRTGSTGIRMLRGGATERLAGGGVAGALVVAGSAPILQRFNIIAMRRIKPGLDPDRRDRHCGGRNRGPGVCPTRNG